MSNQFVNIERRLVPISGDQSITMVYFNTSKLNHAPLLFKNPELDICRRPRTVLENYWSKPCDILVV